MSTHAPSPEMSADMNTAGRSACPPGFSHRALLYADTDEFLDSTVPFIEEALERDQAVMVAVTRPRTRALQGELGRDAQRVRFVEMEELGRNPARIIPAWKRFVDAHASATRQARGIGEPIWRGRGPQELIECRRHESLLNLAFAGSPAWELLCPYDTSALDDDVLACARHTHPELAHRGVLRASHSYMPPQRAPHPFAGELDEPQGAMLELHVDMERLAVARGMVAAHASSAGLSSGRTSDLVLAVNELTSNSVCHGSGHGRLRMWSQEGTLICEVSDDGHIEDPLAGRREPAGDQPRGRGLWIANQICDLVQIRSTPQHTAVRIHMRMSD